MKTTVKAQKTTGLLRKSSLVFACRLAGALLTFLTQLLLARWMGAEQLGIYVLAFSWILLLSTGASLGYPMAALRVIGLGLSQGDDGSIRGFIRQSQWVVMAAGILVAGIAGLFILFSDGQVIPETETLICLLVLVCVPMMAFIRLQGRIAHAYAWFTLATLPSMVLRPLVFLLLIAGVWHYQHSILAREAIQYHGLAILMIMMGQMLVLYRKLQVTLNSSAPARYQTSLWLRTAAPLLVVTLFSQYFAEINLIIAGFFLLPEEIAIYSICFRVTLLIGFGILAVNAAMTPHISRLHANGDHEAIQRLVMKVTQLTFAGGLSAVLVLSVCGEWILGWFGEAFTEGVDILIILALAQLLIATLGPVTLLLSVTGHQNHSFRVSIWALLATIMFNMMLIPALGLKGAAFSVLIVTTFWSFWSHQLVKKHLHVHASILAFFCARNTSS
ncbi:MAG: oligosaccharide flippase family protein [Methylococcales bacterium]|nr:oligosaccharide flippase family protein [Methylococcales bacterium]